MIACNQEAVPPAWARKIRWIWRQDECAYDAEQLEDAWQRIFGEVLPKRHASPIWDAGADCWQPIETPEWRALWAAFYDGGDEDLQVTHDGRIWRYGYDGGAIGLLAGPFDLSGLTYEYKRKG